jgi:signal transduction histidine kinase
MPSRPINDSTSQETLEKMLRRIVQLNLTQIMGQTLLVALGCGLVILVSPSNAFGDEPQKEVLIFNSENVSRPVNSLTNAAIRSALNENSRIQIYDESLDNLRIPNEKYEAEMTRLLQRKYEGMDFDLIFVVGASALRFLLNQKDGLFTDTPMVFLVTDQSRLAGINLGSNITGVSGKLEVAPTVDLALALHPQTQRVVVVAGNGSLDQGLLEHAQKEFRTYEDRLAITYLTGLTLEEMRQRLVVLPDHSIVIFLSFNSPSTTSQQALSLLAASSSAPIYTQTQSSLGYGSVGGQLLSYEALGLSAGRMGLRILAGENAQNIAPETVPSLTMFDWRQLHRWGIDESKLPAGSIVRFKEPTLWAQYRWRIVVFGAFLLLQTLLIVGLLVQRLKRGRAEESSRLSKQNLQKLTGRLIHYQDEERRRIAAELHDGLGQNLVAINIRALIGLRDRDDPDRVKQQLEEISLTANSAIDSVREIAHNLRPHELENLGLVKAVKSMVAKVSDSSSIRVSSELDELDGLLSIEVETSIYRIIQEGLNNIVKHADATQAQISVKRIGKELTIKVADNGKGFSKPMTNRKIRGVGLTGIAERVRMLGGSFALDSAPGRGTLLTLTVSLAEVENATGVVPG